MSSRGVKSRATRNCGRIRRTVPVGRASLCAWASWSNCFATCCATGKTARAQRGAVNVDARVSAAIAGHLVDHPPRDSTWSLVIDTSDNRWNVFVRRALFARAPGRLPMLSDSLAYYALHFTVANVSLATDSALVSVRWDLCYSFISYAFGEEHWSFHRTQSDSQLWQFVTPAIDAVTTGHGICDPYKRKGAQGDKTTRGR